MSEKIDPKNEPADRLRALSPVETQRVSGGDGPIILGRIFNPDHVVAGDDGRDILIGGMGRDHL